MLDGPGIIERRDGIQVRYTRTSYLMTRMHNTSKCETLIELVSLDRFFGSLFGPFR